MQSAAIERYPDRFQVRVPRGLRSAIKAAADKRYTSPAEWARQALLRELAAEGVCLDATPDSSTMQTSG